MRSSTNCAPHQFWYHLCFVHLDFLWGQKRHRTLMTTNLFNQYVFFCAHFWKFKLLIIERYYVPSNIVQHNWETNKKAPRLYTYLCAVLSLYRQSRLVASDRFTCKIHSKCGNLILRSWFATTNLASHIPRGTTCTVWMWLTIDPNDT